MAEQQDNRINRICVQIDYSTTSGFSSHGGYQGEDNAGALAALAELARILTIDGAGQEAIETVHATVLRVADDLAQRKPSTKR